MIYSLSMTDKFTTQGMVLHISYSVIKKIISEWESSESEKNQNMKAVMVIKFMIAGIMIISLG